MIKGAVLGAKLAGTLMAVAIAAKAGAKAGASSKALAIALKVAGHARPVGSHAHHIVAGKAGRAAPAREVLEHFGIGINDAANGVFLPAAQHYGLHTNAYYDMVNGALGSATTREEAIQILNGIAQGLK